MGQRPGSTPGCGWGWFLPEDPHEIFARTPANSCPGPVTSYHKCQDLRSRAGRPPTPTRTQGLHSLPYPDQTGPQKPTSDSAETRRRPAARPPRLARFSATPLSWAGKGPTGRDAIFSARLRCSLELGCGHGAALPCPDSKRRPSPPGSRPPSLHRATYRGLRDPAAISRAATDLERRPARLPA